MSPTWSSTMSLTAGSEDSSKHSGLLFASQPIDEDRGSGPTLRLTELKINYSLPEDAGRIARRRWAILALIGIIIAAIALIVAAWSAWLTFQSHREMVVDRKRRRLEAAAAQASRIHSAANDEPSIWGEPLQLLDSLLAGETEDLSGCRELLAIPVPSKAHSESGRDRAPEVTRCSAMAQRELREKLKSAR